MMRTTTVISTLLLLLLTTPTSAKKGWANKPEDRNNGNSKKLGGFESFDEAATPTTATVGDCTITSTTGTVCSEGVATSFKLTNIYNDEISYECSCPEECDSGNAGTGAYTCTTETYQPDFCGDIDIASFVFTDVGCRMDASDGTMRCEENCYCDAGAHVCTSLGEECCAGSCERVTGPGVKGWEMRCVEEGVESSGGAGKSAGVDGGVDNEIYEEAA